MNQITSFYKGWSLVPQCYLPAVKVQIKTILGITSDVAWQNYLYARTEVSRSEAIAIEALFKTYKIVDVWGNKE